MGLVLWKPLRKWVEWGDVSKAMTYRMQAFPMPLAKIPRPSTASTGLPAAPSRRKARDGADNSSTMEHSKTNMPL